MRKLIVSNLTTLDGYYEGKDRNLEALFDYFHEDYAGDETFDAYNLERWRAADTFLLSGRSAFLGFKDYWSNYLSHPKTTVIRQETARLMNPMQKFVISDHLISDELAPWTNTHIVKLADAHKEIAALKQQSGRDIVIFGGRALWNDLLVYVIRAKVMLKELAHISLEIAQMVVSGQEDHAETLPSWFMVEIARDLPRLVERKNGKQKA